jgi:UDP-GlcNAc:undecaprenyl-phosphate GlcNAc-1-phosphate transferase
MTPRPTLFAPTVLSLAAAAAASFLVTPLVRNFARRQGWMDRPDGRRKLHPDPVPRLGGVAVYFAFAATCAVLLSLQALGWIGNEISPRAYLDLLLACAAVTAIGVLDDIFDVRPIHKIAVQAVAAAYLYVNGYRIDAVSNPLTGDSVELGWLSIPLTILWFVGMSNAFNLIDGMDGLAAGVGLFSTTTLFIACVINERWEIAVVAAALGGALLGFLRYNFNPASIFLGDSGALLIGFALAAIAVRGSMKSSAVVAIAAPLMALAVPLLDAGIAVFRRLVRGNDVFEADGDHIHHRLLHMGLTPRRAVIILYTVAAAFGALSLFTMTSQSQVVGLVILASSVVTWIGIQQLGYAEVAEIQRTLRHGLGNERRSVGNNVYLASLTQRFRACGDASRLWATLVEAANRLQFQRLELIEEGLALGVVGGRRSWEAAPGGDDREPRSVWTVPLVLHGERRMTILLTRSLAVPLQFDPTYLLRALSSGFGARLNELQVAESVLPDAAAR